MILTQFTMLNWFVRIVKTCARLPSPDDWLDNKLAKWMGTIKILKLLQFLFYEKFNKAGMLCYKNILKMHLKGANNFTKNKTGLRPVSRLL